MGIDAAKEIYLGGMVLEEYIFPKMLDSIIKDEIPKPFNPIVHLNPIKHEVELEYQERCKYYQKKLSNDMFRITVLPSESGGPTEKDAITYVKIHAYYKPEDLRLGARPDD